MDFADMQQQDGSPAADISTDRQITPHQPLVEGADVVQLPVDHRRRLITDSSA